jgi:hypothetical protein
MPEMLGWWFTNGKGDPLLCPLGFVTLPVAWVPTLTTKLVGAMDWGVGVSEPNTRLKPGSKLFPVTVRGW